MIGFVLRKTLYDLWDNMFKVVILNLGFIAAAAIPIFLPELARQYFDSTALQMILSVFGMLVCFVYLAAAALAIKSISDYSSFGIGDFIKNLKNAYPAGLVIGLFVFILFLAVTVIIPFYLSIESPVGLVLAAVVFWLTLFALLSLQFYFTVYARLSTNLVKAVKKCIIIFFDNSSFSLFFLLHNFVALLLSVLFFFMFPGPVGVLLYLDEALRLRLLKYDWLEANPGADRRKIPWDAILIAEREKTGSRSLKNFIFPWKD
ncbi:MAG: hypothetical protein LBQ89_01425 [Treponema sp.]|jgi:hypothetical protein|nr:hypothetical protein [Treponema sp.]